MCKNGTWVATLDLHLLPDGALNFSIDTVDNGGNPTHATADYVKAATAPGVSFATPTAGSWMSASASTAVFVSGTCGQSGRNVYLSGAVTGTVPCVNNSWSTTADLSHSVLGNVGITAVHSDGYGNTTDDARWFNLSP